MLRLLGYIIFKIHLFKEKFYNKKRSIHDAVYEVSPFAGRERASFDEQLHTGESIKRPNYHLSVRNWSSTGKWSDCCPAVVGTTSSGTSPQEKPNARCLFPRASLSRNIFNSESYYIYWDIILEIQKPIRWALNCIWRTFSFLNFEFLLTIVPTHHKCLFFITRYSIIVSLLDCWFSVVFPNPDEILINSSQKKEIFVKWKLKICQLRKARDFNLLLIIVSL